MKKRKIIIIIIWILLLLGIFIYSKTRKEEIIEQEAYEPELLDKYEYIDYIGLYDENDLKTETIDFDDKYYNNYIKISGLKDKKLEEQINKKLYDTVNDLKNEEYDYIHSLVSFNAYNILSVSISGYKDNEVIYKTINIDLTTGKNINISDIVNTKNLIKPLTQAYYEAGAFLITSEKKYTILPLEQYNNCIEKNYGLCEKRLGNNTIEELKAQAEIYDKYMAQLEDDALIFARNFDMNTPFYITSAGIIIPDINIYDIKSDDNLIIQTKNNPRLFNYYYKYKTNESIFDGTYEGRKNLMFAEYYQYQHMNAPIIKEIDDYAIIHDDSNNEKTSESESLKKYLNTLDKNNFSFIYDLYVDDNTINFIQCNMTKEIYNNEIKKEFADGMLKSKYSQGYYAIKNEKATCNNKTIYDTNPNVISLSSIDDITSKKIIILNNENKTNEINEYIKTKISELSEKNIAININVKNVTDTQITIEISYYENNNYNNQKIITETFDI